MSEERTEEFSEPRLNIKLAVADDRRSNEIVRKDGTATSSDKSRDKEHDTEAKGTEAKATEAKAVSAAKVRTQSRLPALEDDADIGVEKEHIVARDGKAD